jgi:hypothetical protein
VASVAQADGGSAPKVVEVDTAHGEAWSAQPERIMTLDAAREELRGAMLSFFSVHKFRILPDSPTGSPPASPDVLRAEAARFQRSVDYKLFEAAEHVMACLDGRQ